MCYSSRIVRGIVSLAMLLSAISMSSQSKKISIHKENNQIIDARQDPAIQYLNGEVEIFHASTFMYCDSAILQGLKLRMKHNVSMIQNDTISLFADSIHYDGEALQALLYGRVILNNGRNQRLFTESLRYDIKNKVAYYKESAKLEDGTSTLLSKRGVYDLKSSSAYFYENVTMHDAEFNLTTDSIQYILKNNLLVFIAPVIVKKDTSLLFSESGWYNIDNNSGDFIGNAQYLSGKTKAKADTISYDGTFDLVILKTKEGRSEYISENDTVYAKIITYNAALENYNLEGEAYYKSNTNRVEAEKIFYDKKTDKFQVKGKSQINDPPYIINAESLDYDKTLQLGVADGNVVWQDTSAKTTILSDHLYFNGAENIMRAFNDTLRPLLINVIDNDTLFLQADTLKSFRVLKEIVVYPDLKVVRRLKAKQNNETELPLVTNTYEKDTIQLMTKVDSVRAGLSLDTIFTGKLDTLDFFGGVGQVKLFKSDMQAICDSLIFSKRDSTFTLYNNPVVWADSSQIIADTIKLTMKSGKIDKMNMLSQVVLLDTKDEIFFNQVQGEWMEASFLDNIMSTMYIKGNSKIIYYMLDSRDQYLGVNITESSSMTFFFDKNKVSKIKAYIEPISKVYPMLTTNHESLKVKGFKWLPQLRPLRNELWPFSHDKTDALEYPNNVNPPY